MSSISSDSADDICLISSGDLNVTSNSSSTCVRNNSNSSYSDNYTPEQSKQLSLKKIPNHVKDQCYKYKYVRR